MTNAVTYSENLYYLCESCVRDAATSPASLNTDTPTSAMSFYVTGREGSRSTHYIRLCVYGAMPVRAALVHWHVIPPRVFFPDR